MKYWADVKKWAIGTLGLEESASDAEIHQAALDKTKQADPPKTATDQERLTKAEADIVELRKQVQILSKKPVDSIADREKGTTATDVVHERAYKKTPLSADIYRKKNLVEG
jgi:curved DNA-binding protein CbpA